MRGPPWGRLRAPPGSRLFLFCRVACFARFCPFVPAFRGLLSCVGARALDTIETSATSWFARPGFVGVCSPRPPPRGSRRPPPTLLDSVSRGFVCGSSVGPGRPASLPPLRSPGRALPVHRRGLRRFGARVRAFAGPTQAGGKKIPDTENNFQKNLLQMLTNAGKCGIIINRGDVGAPTLSLNSIQSRVQKGLI